MRISNKLVVLNHTFLDPALARTLPNIACLEYSRIGVKLLTSTKNRNLSEIMRTFHLFYL